MNKFARCQRLLITPHVGLGGVPWGTLPYLTLSDDDSGLSMRLDLDLADIWTLNHTPE